MTRHSRRIRLTTVSATLLLAVSGCAGAVAPYVTVAGAITLPAPAGQLANAPVSIQSLTGNLVGASTTNASQTVLASFDRPAQGSYSLALDATTLPGTPTLFLITLHAATPGTPGDGSLLEAVVALSRPAGKGPELGTVTADLDATDSLAAMALQYRQSQGQQINASAVDPTAIANYLGNQTNLPFELASAFVQFLAGQTSTAPCATVTLAQQASQALPTDLTTVN